MKALLKQPRAIILLALFGVISAYWLTVFVTGTADDTARNVIGSIYGSVALIGGIFGLLAARQWGGLKSLLGRSITILALGLLLQEFGQLGYAYYAVVLGTDIPYPSFGDLGYFGSVLFYIYGAILLLKVNGSSISFRTLTSKLVALLLPLALLVGSYLFFLQGYEFDWTNPLAVLLDFGAPLGQATYLAIALLALLLSRKMMGGLMLPRILLLLGALFIQYAADFNFLYLNSHEIYETAGYGDYLYLLAYLFMGLALVNLSLPIDNKKTEAVQPEVSNES